jgi:hypothetical protein
VRYKTIAHGGRGRGLKIFTNLVTKFKADPLNVLALKSVLNLISPRISNIRFKVKTLTREKSEYQTKKMQISKKNINSK